MPQNFSASQLRAARGLLNWTRAQLAEISGVSEPTIQRMETGGTTPHGKSVSNIIRAFDDNGVEFTDNQGVRLKPTGIDVYDGLEMFDKFYDFLYEHLKQNGGDVCLSIYDETLPAKYRKNPELHRNRMRELVSRGDVTFRVLATKSDFVSYDYVKFKMQHQQHATPTGFYAFGDCLALLSFVNPQSPYIVVIRSGPLAEAYRQEFEITWKNTKSPQPKR